MDVSPAFADPDGIALIYTVSSSAPHLATVIAAARALADLGDRGQRLWPTLQRKDPG